MAAALVVGSRGSRPAELVNKFSAANPQELRKGHKPTNRPVPPVPKGILNVPVLHQSEPVLCLPCTIISVHWDGDKYLVGVVLNLSAFMGGGKILCLSGHVLISVRPQI